MKRIITLIILAISTISVAQENSKWTVGVGFNSIDNTAKKGTFSYESKDWNIAPVASKFSASYEVEQYFSVATEVAISKFSGKSEYKGESIYATDVNFVAVDVNAKYNVDHFFTQAKWFDASLVGGLGYFWIGEATNRSFNPGVSMDFWITDSYGIRVQSLARIAFENVKLSNNHIQHSVEFVFKF